MFSDDESRYRREVGSLDRFVHTRGLALAGGPLRARIFRCNIASYGVLGVLLLANGAFHGLASDLRSIIPFLGIATGLTVATGIRTAMMQRSLPAPATDVRLSPDAMRLLQRLVEHLEGWSFYGRRGRKRMRKALLKGLALPNSHGRRCEDLLSPAAFTVLENAAREYNRIAAALAAPDNSPTLRRMAPSIRASAEEAMAEILQLAALLDEFPEGVTPARAAAARTEELRTLAAELDRLQNLVSPPAFVNGGSRIQGVLEELRADRIAREELREDDPQTLRIRRE